MYRCWYYVRKPRKGELVILFEAKFSCVQCSSFLSEGREVKFSWRNFFKNVFTCMGQWGREIRVRAFQKSDRALKISVFICTVFTRGKMYAFTRYFSGIWKTRADMLKTWACEWPYFTSA